jgi:hypothetical protein
MLYWRSPFPEDEESVLAQLEEGYSSPQRIAKEIYRLTKKHNRGIITQWPKWVAGKKAPSKNVRPKMIYCWLILHTKIAEGEKGKVILSYPVDGKRTLGPIGIAIDNDPEEIRRILFELAKIISDKVDWDDGLAPDRTVTDKF